MSGREVQVHGLMRIIALDTPSLGDRSYLVHDGEVAFVVDPQRDIDRVLDLIDQTGVRLLRVFKTHRSEEHTSDSSHYSRSRMPSSA